MASMIELRALCDSLRIVAEVRRDQMAAGNEVDPSGHFDAGWIHACDRIATSLISEACPPALKLPGPARAEQQQDTARACFERVYADLCAGKP